MSVETGGQAKAIRNITRGLIAHKCVWKPRKITDFHGLTERVSMLGDLLNRSRKVFAVSHRFIVLAGAILFALTSCAHPTPYQPRSASSELDKGYSDERIAADRYRVTFSGNSLTSRETVEEYLLYRAAEVTIEQGYDWFSVVGHEMDHVVTREITRDPAYRPYYGTYYGSWLPYWRYYVRGRGWYSWDPYLADTFWADRYEERQIEEFEATAEIRLGRDPRPEHNGQIYDAREVIERIGPRVIRDYSKHR